MFKITYSVCACVCMCVDSYVVIRGLLGVVNSLLPPSVSQTSALVNRLYGKGFCSVCHLTSPRMKLLQTIQYIILNTCLSILGWGQPEILALMQIVWRKVKVPNMFLFWFSGSTSLQNRTVMILLSQYTKYLNLN